MVPYVYNIPKNINLTASWSFKLTVSKQFVCSFEIEGPMNQISYSAFYILVCKKTSGSQINFELFTPLYSVGVYTSVAADSTTHIVINTKHTTQKRVILMYIVNTSKRFEDLWQRVLSSKKWRNIISRIGLISLYYPMFAQCGHT